jgi:hypothetical protein
VANLGPTHGPPGLCSLETSGGTMAIYRVQCVHVDYWRGTPHRWNNTFHYLVGTGSPDFATIITSMRAILQGLGTAQVHGGLAEIKVYSSAGGTPVYSQTYFDWTTPGSWVAYTGTGIWPSGAVQAAGEAAALFEINAGMSSSGKPVTLKTWWHAFTASTTPETGGVDFSPTVQTAAVTQYNKLQSIPGSSGPAFVLVNPAGNTVASTSTLRPYVVSHQRVRGRRRRALVTASGKYTGPTVKVPPSIVAD